MAVYKIGLMTYDGKTVKTSNYQSLNGITNVIWFLAKFFKRLNYCIQKSLKLMSELLINPQLNFKAMSANELNNFKSIITLYNFVCHSLNQHYEISHIFGHSIYNYKHYKNDLIKDLDIKKVFQFLALICCKNL